MKSQLILLGAFQILVEQRSFMATSLFRFSAVGVLLISIAAFWFWWNWSPSNVPDDDVYHVRRGTIADSISESGKLECQNISPVSCQLDGVENKVVFLKKQGEFVEKGETVVRFDASILNQKIVDAKKEANDARQLVRQSENNLENQKNKNENKLLTATNAVDNAQLALQKYEKCDYQISVLELEGTIAESRAELDRQIEELDRLDELVKKGFRTSRQRFEKSQLVVKAKAELERDRQKLDAFKQFEHQLNLSEKTEKFKAAQRNLNEVKINIDLQSKKLRDQLDAAKEALRLAQQQLAYLQEQLQFCEVKANASGVLRYVEEDLSGERQILGLGKAVRSRQQLFYLVNKERMQVICMLDDTVVQRARVGQSVIVRPHSHPRESFSGKVRSISVLGIYNGGGSYGYRTWIDLDELPNGVTLNPGVEADLEIIVEARNDVVLAPLTAVTEHLGEHFVFRQSEGDFVAAPVKIGTFNDDFVEIVSGLATADVIKLNCYDLARAEFPSSYLENSKRKSEQIARLLDAPKPNSAQVPWQRLTAVHPPQLDSQ